MPRCSMVRAIARPRSIAAPTRWDRVACTGRCTAPHPGSHAAQPKGDTGPSSLAFQGINTKMHGAMDIVFTGNADVDFVKGMIPHHQGAIEMAKTVLAFGKDPEVRKFAEEIIRAQESEIALMQGWLKKNGR